jgi:hypothetical protein
MKQTTKLAAMFGQFGKALVVASLILVLGWHWIILQSVAWVRMAAEYSAVLPIKEALVKTFDGRSPCQLCKFVAEGKKSEKEQETQKLVMKLDLLLVRDTVALFPPSDFQWATGTVDLLSCRGSSPPSPPPRSLPVHS